MGSRVSCNDIDDPSRSTNNISPPNDNVTINNSNINDQKLYTIPNNGESTPSHVYIKDKFRLEFLDCNCCCDTSKKVANCDFQGINILQDLYEMVSRLNIHPDVFLKKYKMMNFWFELF
jgi:hypothetical protein